MISLIGIGNNLRGDDGIALHLVETLCRRGLATDVEARLIGANGIDLLTHFVPTTTGMVIIDAARMGLDPGDSRLITPAELQRRPPPPRLSTHHNDLLELIDYAHTLGCPMPPIRILAIQPTTLAPGDALSPPLQQRFESYLQQVNDALTTLAHPTAEAAP